MVFSFEHAIDADVIAVTQCGVAPREDLDSATPTRVFQLECRVVVSTARSGLLQGRGRTLQRDGLVIEARRFGDHRADIGCIGGN